MINENKLLTDLGLSVYDELLKAHGLNLVETAKESKSMSITYNEGTRILSFSFGNKIEQAVVTDDGNGNVIFALSSSTITDDGEGNVNTTGISITDDGNGNVYTS